MLGNGYSVKQGWLMVVSLLCTCENGLVLITFWILLTQLQHSLQNVSFVQMRWSPDWQQASWEMNCLEWAYVQSRYLWSIFFLQEDFYCWTLLFFFFYSNPLLLDIAYRHFTWAIIWFFFIFNCYKYFLTTYFLSLVQMFYSGPGRRIVGPDATFDSGHRIPSPLLPCPLSSPCWYI